MTTTRTITNRAERQAGDHYEITFTDGAVLSGNAREHRNALWVGDRQVRIDRSHIDQDFDVALVTVTREVETPPEPTKFAAVVALGGGGYAVRVYVVSHDPWFSHSHGWWSWAGLLDNHGVTRVVFEGVDL